MTAQDADLEWLRGVLDGVAEHGALPSEKAAKHRLLARLKAADKMRDEIEDLADRSDPQIAGESELEQFLRPIIAAYDAACAK